MKVKINKKFPNLRFGPKNWLNHKIALTGFLVIGFCALIIIGKLLFQPHTTPVTAVSATIPRHASHLYDPEFFRQADEKGHSYVQHPSELVKGGIIPHHLLAAPLISAFFEGIKNRNVGTVILLGPNHFAAGPYEITTSAAEWTTIFGTLKPDIERITSLKNNQVADIHEDLFENEHAIYGLTPFIKKTFPRASIVPIVLKNSASRAQCDKLVTWLKQHTDSTTIVIASVDFSHYLPSFQADSYDKQSIEALIGFNRDAIWKLDYQKNADSPVTLYTLISLLQNTTSQLLQNTNSAKLTNQPDLTSTTSYVTMYFLEKPQ